ncbi:MAG: histidine kinase [Terriglobales bacterium]
MLKHAAALATAPPSALRAQRLLAQAASTLAPAWRRRFAPRPSPSARALYALEQLLLPQPRSGTAAAMREQLEYVAARLPRLGLRPELVRAAQAALQPLALAVLRQSFSAGAARQLYDGIQLRTALAVAEAFAAEQSRSLQALLATLDAELNAAGLAEMLGHLLQQAAHLFPCRWGEVLLAEEGTGPSGGTRLRHVAAHGLDHAMIEETAGVGSFFQGVLRRGEPGFLLDAANDPRVAQPYFRSLEVKSLWAVPLIRRRAPQPATEALGVLVLGFDRVHECLPQEMELLRALAERSSLAIERARLNERFRRQQRRVLELSRRLLDAQDEERRRISRDLHDETGQALLALRLYLEMGLREGNPDRVAGWLQRGLALVDQSVAELRRILAQLSPLLLDELGLEPALRLEMRRLRTEHHWLRARLEFRAPIARLDRSLEILVYRVVLEGLRNIARHAQARRVSLRLQVTTETMNIRLSDDGVGLPAAGAAHAAASAHFGLRGMRERVRLAGGSLTMQPNLRTHSDAPGTLLLIRLPLPQPETQAAAARVS